MADPISELAADISQKAGHVMVAALNDQLEAVR
jgi:hypothetical protein